MKLYYQDCGTYIAVAVESDNPEEIELQYNSFYNFIYVTKTFQLAIDRKLIYTVCLKTMYESLRVLEKNDIVLWNNDVQTFL